MDFAVKGNKIVIIPKIVIDRSLFPIADDEYTPDIKAGRTYGPFTTAGEMVTHMKERLRKNAGAKKLKRSG